MENFIVVFDACVLYAAPLRDLLMRLALTDLFRAKWTNAIHHEWIENLLAKRSDLTRERLTRTRDLMNENILDCLVCDYESIIPTLNLPDPKDRHVLAAAVKANADTIVTKNLRDFPAKTLQKYGIYPDDFIKQLLDYEPSIVLSAVKKARASLKSPPKSAAEYISSLSKQTLPLTVSLLQEYEKLI